MKTKKAYAITISKMLGVLFIACMLAAAAGCDEDPVTCKVITVQDTTCTGQITVQYDSAGHSLTYKSEADRMTYDVLHDSFFIWKDSEQIKSFTISSVQFVDFKVNQ